jgi:hypothetical protein
MRFLEFSKASFDFWNERLNSINIAQQQGRINPPDATILYPTILLCTETRRFFIMELIGGSPRSVPLTERSHREASIDRYFGQFDFTPSVSMIQYPGENHTAAEASINRGLPIHLLRRPT